ncbi:MAG: hypothetical protein IKI08_08055, partial [Selenomonadaceae bacterium]|nr:hypothetical protein [Selenomonadaceae bacterium]
DNGLSNSPAGCVSILSFHLFFSPISKKWIVLSYLHNPFYITKISIRRDHEQDFEIFNVGTYGLCISCAGEISSKLLCEDCNHDGCELCQECENYCSETLDVINRRNELSEVVNADGDTILFCQACREQKTVPA